MLYFVTDRKVAVKDFYRTLQEAVEGGVDGIILREKDLKQPELFSMGKKVKAIVEGTDTKLIINGNLSVARDLKAQGYHMGFEKFMEEDKKTLKEFRGRIGVSVHSVKEAKIAEKNGADYLLAGHVFQTLCKKGLEPRGISWLKEIMEAGNLPVIAIGGIDPNNLGKLQSLGLHGIAVRSLIMESPEVKNTVKSLRNKWLID
ncbi:thiamine phosphate synthase [Isachenkonia alkalipeptolytica]|uniref:Thiamine phosphate synthase n=1 Tax=Isachenkonia alkalipeptolytica TaxID=2565777 RepID=A0AA44BCT9_9CLOT|nr:thiamine phosphate synthase [Isachenkonia alkalipeptolytica]NBG87253.1 thiamine phosphate synthase [Isachenkonia alkalipeptolytica]